MTENNTLSPSTPTIEQPSATEPSTTATPPPTAPVAPASPQFSVGQVVVLPSQGVGVVSSITTAQFHGEPTMYYHITMTSEGMNVSIPITAASSMGLRATSSADAAQAALEVLSSPTAPATSDWKMRYQSNLELLRHGTIADIALVVRTLYHRSLVKELPTMERSLYDSALTLLQSETAISLGIENAEALKRIEESLGGSSGGVSAIRAADGDFLGDDDDDEDDEAEVENEDGDDSDDGDDDGDDDDDGEDDDAPSPGTRKRSNRTDGDAQSVAARKRSTTRTSDAPVSANSSGDEMYPDAMGEDEPPPPKRRRGRRSRVSDEDDFDF